MRVLRKAYLSFISTGAHKRKRDTSMEENGYVSRLMEG